MLNVLPVAAAAAGAVFFENILPKTFVEPASGFPLTTPFGLDEKTCKEQEIILKNFSSLPVQQNDKISNKIIKRRRLLVRNIHLFAA